MHTLKGLPRALDTLVLVPAKCHNPAGYCGEKFKPYTVFVLICRCSKQCKNAWFMAL